MAFGGDLTAFISDQMRADLKSSSTTNDQGWSGFLQR
jgi:hypothetical protein